MDGEITIATKQGNAEKTIDELKDLLFELGYVQLHTSEKNTHAIFKKVTEIIQVLNDFEQEGANKQKVLPQFYTRIATELFDIVAILKEDLYSQSSKPIAAQTITELLESCDLFVDTKEVDSRELQNYFWNGLQAQLMERGYAFEKKDFSFDVNQYYARSRNRHRYYGIQFPIYHLESGIPVLFRIELENEFYYGVLRHVENEENALIEDAISTVKAFQSSPAWFAWKWFDHNKLDFWTLESPAFALLKNPRKRDRLIKDIAAELDMYIQQIQASLHHREESEKKPS
ncbi:hypothetical protein HPC37_03685 [Pasteurellaceae bacterium 20609_3]|uniref:hypothetical protein n=1 Tax=Spirabiliibacterium mucosae TaxID=28156 RepID=UPI001AACA01C|nr:hypothetical protein [Spirabiliibacterium mucosae]MBE2897949.1 hypothetical protein [Spirabiliibacterium mucosae]